MLHALDLGFIWGDPDGYMGQAARLTRRGWHMQPFMYGAIVKAPLYPIFLAMVISVVSANREMVAAVIQIGMNGAIAAALFLIGRDLHSPRTGVIAAVIFAVWLPSLASTHLFLQEQLHIPLVVAGLALLVRAAARSSAPRQFAMAGAVLGLAALARSMPVYYIGPAAVLYVALAADRRAAVRQAAALVLGLVVVILPWCLYASAKTGQFVLIDTMGSASLGMTYREARPDLHGKPAGAIDGVVTLWRAVASNPTRYFNDRVVDFQRLFRLTAVQWLGTQPPAATRTGARAIEAVTRTSDLLFAVSAILAPLGIALARRRREAMLVGLWFGLNLALLVMFTWNGVRYRAPYEPAMIVLAAVVLAAGWKRSKAIGLAVALAASVAIAVSVAASVPAARRKASYGFDAWTESDGGLRTKIAGEAGFTLIPAGGFLDLKLIHAESPAAGRPVHVHVWLNGQSADEIDIGSGERQLQYVWNQQMTHVVLEARFQDGEPAPLVVDVGRSTVIGGAIR